MVSFPILHERSSLVPRELRETEPEGFSFMRSAPESRIEGTMNPPSPNTPPPSIAEFEKGSPRYPGNYQSFLHKDPMSSCLTPTQATSTPPPHPRSQEPRPPPPPPRTGDNAQSQWVAQRRRGQQERGGRSGDGGGAGSELTPGEEAREGPVFQRE